MGTLIEKVTNFLEELKEFRKEKAEKAQRTQEEGSTGRGEGGREETEAGKGEGKGKGKEDGAWRDILRGFGLRHRGGVQEKKQDVSREKHGAWRESFRRRGRRGADVEVGVDGHGGI